MISARTTGCCESLYNAGATGANWLSHNSKSLAASAGETAKNVWTAVSAFFSMVAQKLGAFFAAAKDATVAGFGKAKEAFTALPKEAKIAGAVGLLATAVATALCCKCFSKKEEKPAEVAAIAGAAANAPAQVVAQPEQQVVAQPEQQVVAQVVAQVPAQVPAQVVAQVVAQVPA